MVHPHIDPADHTDLGRTYSEVAPQLRRVLGSHLRAPEWVLDDACQMAWETLLVHGADVDRSRLLSWLATTARREALRLMRRSATELAPEADPGSEEPAVGADPAQAVEFWERMGRIRRLPRRQQQMVWMHGLGFGYREIAAETGESVRSVERQLSGARRQLDAAA